MRKHDPRKWLHAVLDLLPVILIPVFMVYSHRHIINDLSVDYSVNKVVDFNQDGKEIASANYGSSNLDYGTVSFNTDELVYTVTIVGGSWNNGFQTKYKQSETDHKYYVSADMKTDISDLTFSFIVGNTNTSNFALTSSYNKYSFVLVSQSNTYTYFCTRNNSQVGGHVYFKNYMCIDLTLMFGIGNEPTVEQFNTWYPNDYYAYSTGRDELLKDYQTVTYNNTDIGSQLLYSIYKPVNDYMNFNNVFNFGQIYDWLQLNIFGGTAPMSVFIVWNIVLYEFLMDLIFLLYALFMFFIDFCTNLIDRFHTKCSGGK